MSCCHQRGRSPVPQAQPCAGPGATFDLLQLSSDVSLTFFSGFHQEVNLLFLSKNVIRVHLPTEIGVRSPSRWGCCCLRAAQICSTTRAAGMEAKAAAHSTALSFGVTESQSPAWEHQALQEEQNDMGCNLGSGWAKQQHWQRNEQRCGVCRAQRCGAALSHQCPPAAEKPSVGARSHEIPNQHGLQLAIHNQSQQSRENEGANADLPEPGQSPAGSSRAEQPRCPQTPWDGASEGWEPCPQQPSAASYGVS